MVFIRTTELIEYYLSLVSYSRWNHSGGGGGGGGRGKPAFLK